MSHRPATMPLDTVVVDYGGVLTNPLLETFGAFVERVGMDMATVAGAFAAATERHGVSPMAALEVGEITEGEMVRRLLAELPAELQPRATMAMRERSFGELWFQGRRPNQPFIDFLRELRGDGHRLALLTNNVLEWEVRWRADLPVDELFDLVVNSSHEGVRKPEPRVYEILLHRLCARPAQCLFVDDSEENCAAAAELGMRTVRFVDNASTVEAVRDALAPVGARRGPVR